MQHTPAKFSRQDYLNSKCDFAQYYSQFVTQSIVNCVRECFEKKIATSNDPHLNDIPLASWDMLAHNIGLASRVRIGLEDAGDGVTQAGLVCILKTAARMI